MNGDVDHKPVEANSIPCCMRWYRYHHLRTKSQRVCCDCNAVEYVVLDNERAGNVCLKMALCSISSGKIISKRLRAQGKRTRYHSWLGVRNHPLDRIKDHSHERTSESDSEENSSEQALRALQLHRQSIEHCRRAFPPALVQQFVKMFVQVQDPFVKHAPLVRKTSSVTIMSCTSSRAS
jgi:hypothetical protein